MEITVRQLRYFVAVADAGKISEAASSLGVVRSSVSEAMQSLEQQSGVQLFERRADGIELTLSGKLFVAHARRIIADVAEARAALINMSSEVRGTVALGVTFTVSAYLLPRILIGFRRSFPQVEVVVKEMPADDIERELGAGELELALMLSSTLRQADTFDIRTLIRSPRRLWVAANHRLVGHGPIRLADVVDEPYVLLTTDQSEETTLRYWEMASLRPRIVFRTTAIEAVRSLVASGYGVTILSDLVYRPWSHEGDRIEAVELTDPIPAMDVGVVRLRSNELSPAAGLFVDYCSRLDLR